MSEPHTKMGNGREFDIIRDLLARWGDDAKGIGDDAAVFSVPRGEQLVASVDAFVENVHFRAEWITPREVGYRAVTAALSDLAAMAALPTGVLLALNVPESWRPAIMEIADGAGEAVRAAGTVILGGNMSSASQLSIGCTVVGHAYSPLRRSGAKIGDRLYVTGTLGGPKAAIRAWEQGAPPKPNHRERFARPVARIREARLLAQYGAHACIDVSDGLSSEVNHLAAASGTGFAVQVERIPLIAGGDVNDALQGGEEYELLVAAPPLDAGALTRLLGCALTEIGSIVAEGATFSDHGKPVVVADGHRHFS